MYKVCTKFLQSEFKVCVKCVLKVCVNFVLSVWEVYVRCLCKACTWLKRCHWLSASSPKKFVLGWVVSGMVGDLMCCWDVKLRFSSKLNKRTVSKILFKSRTHFGTLEMSIFFVHLKHIILAQIIFAISLHISYIFSPLSLFIFINKSIQISIW